MALAAREEKHSEVADGLFRAFFEQAKPVGVICHGPWTLVEADVVRGRTLTSWPSLKTDLENAGARVFTTAGTRAARAHPAAGVP